MESGDGAAHFSSFFVGPADVLANVLRRDLELGQDVLTVFEAYIFLVLFAHGMGGVIDVEHREGSELQVQRTIALRRAESCGRLDGPHMLEVCGKPLPPFLPCLDAYLELAPFDGRAHRV